MEFNVSNNVVQLCLKGMTMEGSGMTAEAGRLFEEAWNAATHDFEKFMASYFLARHQDDLSERLKWLETALQWALKIDDGSVRSALPPLYSSMAECYAGLNAPDRAKEHLARAASCDVSPSDKGPFYHGTKADLKIGDLLTAGGASNYKDGLKMNHIYFTGLASGAGLAAALAKGERKERVYVVEPTGRFEDDPNVTNKKFPGNLTRSYRSEAPLRIVGEAADWAKLAPEELEQWRKKVAGNKGEIVN